MNSSMNGRQAAQNNLHSPPAVSGLPVSRVQPTITEGNSSQIRERGTVVGHQFPEKSHCCSFWGVFDQPLGALLLTNVSHVSAWYGIPFVEGARSIGNICAIELALDTSNGLLYTACPGNTPAADTVTAINVTSGIFATTNITNSTSLTSPESIVYDRADGLVYARAASTPFVTVLNGTQIVGTVAVPGTVEGSQIFDPVTGDVYVCYTAGTPTKLLVAVINGTRVVGTLSIPYNSSANYLGAPTILLDPNRELLYFGTVLNGSVPALVAVNASMTNGSTVEGVIRDPAVNASINLGYGDNYEVGYNPMNQAIFMPGRSGIVVVSGNHVDGVIPDVNSSSGKSNFPSFFFYYPPTGAELVQDDAGIGFISTFLSESLINVTPLGAPPDSMEVGRMSLISSSLAGIGTGNDTVQVAASPAGWVTCNATISDSDSITVGKVGAQCLPSHIGNVTIWLNVSDGVGTVSSWIAVQIFATPIPSTPTAFVSGSNGVSAADVGQLVTFEATVPPNSSPDLAYEWIGIPGTADCSGLNTSDPACTFFVVQNLTIAFNVTDAHGVSSTSPGLAFEVYPRLLVFPPSLNRASADVKQRILISTSPEGGSGRYVALNLDGVTGSYCTGIGVLSVSCSFATPGAYSISANVSDSNHNSVAGPPATLQVYPLPALNAISASRISSDVGQSVELWANGSVGAGGDQFEWDGLPGPCLVMTTASPTCTPSTPGTYEVSAVATDRDGGASLASTSVKLTVFGALGVQSLSSFPSSPFVGSKLWLNTSTIGGSGGYAFRWSDLPAGCTGASQSVECVPTAAGTYNVIVAVEDQNGEIARSATLTITISDRSSETNLLADQSVDWVLIGAGAGCVAVVAILYSSRRRKRGARAAE